MRKPLRHIDGRKFTHSSTLRETGVSGQLDDPIALVRDEEPPVSVEQGMRGHLWTR